MNGTFDAYAEIPVKGCYVHRLNPAPAVRTEYSIGNFPRVLVSRISTLNFPHPSEITGTNSFLNASPLCSDFSSDNNWKVSFYHPGL